MNLYYFCSSCKKENSFKTKATNRFELQQERGDEINESCKYCGTLTKRRINRVHSKANILKYLVGGALGILLTLILIVIIPPIFIVFAFPSIMSIPFMAWKRENRKAVDFNKIMIKES